MSNFLLIVLDFVHDYKNLPRLKIFGRGYNVSVLLKKYVAVLDPGNNDLVDLRDQTPKLRRCEALNETRLHEILNETGANKEDERNDIAETVQGNGISWEPRRFPVNVVILCPISGSNLSWRAYSSENCDTSGSVAGGHIMKITAEVTDI